MIFLLIFLLLAPPPGGPITIPIQNPSFAQGTSGWQFGAGSTVGTDPSGAPAAIAGYASTFSQTLTTTPASLQVLPPPSYYKEGFYTLTFSVQNYYPTYPGWYDVEIDFGTQKLCESYGVGTIGKKQITMICPSSEHLVIGNHEPGGGPAQGNYPFVLNFAGNDEGGGNGGWPLYFTNVSFTFTPD